jgi:hypothetical protein
MSDRPGRPRPGPPDRRLAGPPRRHPARRPRLGGCGPRLSRMPWVETPSPLDGWKAPGRAAAVGKAPTPCAPRPVQPWGTPGAFLGPSLRSRWRSPHAQGRTSTGVVRSGQGDQREQDNGAVDAGGDHAEGAAGAGLALPGWVHFFAWVARRSLRPNTQAKTAGRGKKKPRTPSANTTGPLMRLGPKLAGGCRLPPAEGEGQHSPVRAGRPGQQLCGPCPFIGTGTGDARGKAGRSVGEHGGEGPG